MTDLKTETILKDVQNKGPKTAIWGLFVIIIFGVIDSFTAKIVPTIADAIREQVYPSTVTLKFSDPIQIPDNGLRLRRAYEEADSPNRPRFRAVSKTIIVLIAPPGNYILTVYRDNVGEMETAMSPLRFEKSGEERDVRITPSDWRMVSAPDLDLAAEEAESPSSPTNLSIKLVGTRYIATSDDFEQITTVDDQDRKAVLSLALGEVGVSEIGTTQEQDRVLSYWDDVNFPNPSLKTAWVSAFVNWVMKGTGLPYTRSAVALSWLQRGAPIDLANAKPGMLAIFDRGMGRGIVGIILRKRDDCLELIAGNVADRVSITCVSGSLVGIRNPVRAPNTESAY